ncbi:minichromosome maintenance protein 4 [Colletotrichum tofieldiae]|nr:minichromosome maintenance protein 4 [Colletotrichum tofieldiae]
MSSPSKRSTRSSTAGTPRRSTRNNPDAAARSSPAPADEEAQRPAETPRTNRRSQLASSPLFYESSPAQTPSSRRNAPANGDVSSPLRNMSNSQSTAVGPAPAHRCVKTLIPNPLVMVTGPPCEWISESPGRSIRPLQSDLRSESSGLFVTDRSSRSRRGDINSEGLRTPRRRLVLDPSGRVTTDAPGSDAPSFSNPDPNTSEADRLGGRDFLRHFTRKYQLYREGWSEADVQAAPDAESKPYWEALENMLLLGTTRLYLDIADLNTYPPTRKLWYHIQAYPQEIIPIMDQSVHDLMVELARNEGQRQRASQSSAGDAARRSNTAPSSDVAFPSSDHPGSDAPTRGRLPTSHRRRMRLPR